jgi:hypothetical protein
MVNWPVRLPVAVGANVTRIVQLPPGCTVVPWQLSVVTVKSLALVTDGVGVSAMLPVLVKVTVSVLLLATGTGVGKISGLGLATAVVKLVPPVHNPVCQMPRP